MQKAYIGIFLIVMSISGCESPRVESQVPTFIEIVVKNHLVSHGFNENNEEVVEEVLVEQPRKKLIRVDRIQSISEKYILTSYGYGRLVYWEYEGSYDELKELLGQNDN